MRIKTPVRKKRIIFLRTDSNRKRFKQKWGSPKGGHNKKRLNKQGHQANPAIGYRNPKKIRGLNKDNLLPVIVYNHHDLKKLDKSKHAIFIAKTVGIRKKLIILEQAKKLNLKIYNIKNEEKFIENIKKKREEKLKTTKKREEEKKKSKQESLKKAEEKKDEKKEEKEGKTSEDIKEEKKEAQKEELDLIKKEKQSKHYETSHNKVQKDSGRVKEMIIPESNK